MAKLFALALGVRMGWLVLCSLDYVFYSLHGNVTILRGPPPLQVGLSLVRFFNSLVLVVWPYVSIFIVSLKEEEEEELQWPHYAL